MDSKQRLSFKLAGLRAGTLVQAAAQDSGLVASALKLSAWRKRTKRRIKRLFKRYEVLAADKLHLLVHVCGGIGDVCMARVLVQKWRQTLPQADITLAYDRKSTVDMVFPDGLIDRWSSPDYVPEQFDVVLSGCHLLMYDYINWPRVEKLAPQIIPVLKDGLDLQACFKPFAQYSPYLDGQLAEIAIAHGGSRITNLGWFSGLEIHQNDEAFISLPAQTTQAVLQRWDLADKKYITIHDGINNQTEAGDVRQTRCWPQEHWAELVRLIKNKFPQLTVVQLGGNQSRPFDFADVCLAGKTEVSDLPHLLSKSCLHIDGESGMVHLANLTKTPCVVLFGPSKAAYLGYARNTNLSAPVCGGCMNINKYWMTRCLLDVPSAKQCLASILPQTVFEAVCAYLAK